jgi:electron transfer flavoprotein alpha subunit
MRNVLAILIAAKTLPGRTEVEVISAGKRLRDELGGSLTAAIVGPADSSCAKLAFQYGADRAVTTNHTLLNEYQPELLVAALQQICEATQAEMILFPGTTYGLEVAPLLGYKIGASVILDCVSIHGNEENNMAVVKPVYGGKANWGLLVKKPPVVAALRARSVEPGQPQQDKTGEVTELEIKLEAALARSRIIERKIEESGGQRLEDARMIVSGGRGIGGSENFASLEELARELGGTVGASRAACDLGWVPASWQIGQTGKKVAPDLYLAIGISGASQHMVGVTGAKHVVAINKDAKAPIFQAAELGVVEDYRKFVPAFLQALKQHKAG